MNQEPLNSSPFTAFENVRPALEDRIERYKDGLCREMIEIVDQLQTLEQHLRRDAEHQEMVDARFNAMAYREAADALVKADAALALAARKMSFHS
jgi:hypothetical protein